MDISRKRALLLLLASILFLSDAQPVLATTIASVKVNDLFKEADAVAIVHILSGDSERYPVTVYKAGVITAL